MCEFKKSIVIRANGGSKKYLLNTNLVLGSISHLYRLSYCAEGQYQKRRDKNENNYKKREKECK